MPFDSATALTWYRRNRTRSRALFDMLTDDAYYSQPIALRHPIVFYEGHLPGFSSQWQSDIRIANVGSLSKKVQLNIIKSLSTTTNRQNMIKFVELFRRDK